MLRTPEILNSLVELRKQAHTQQEMPKVLEQALKKQEAEFNQLLAIKDVDERKALGIKRQIEVPTFSVAFRMSLLERDFDVALSGLQRGVP
jgi:hypothetical protein